MKLKLLALAVSVVFSAGCAQTPTSPAATSSAAVASPTAAAPAAAQHVKYPHVVDYAYVKPHATLICSEDTALLVDSRPVKRFEAGHIPGSVNIPDPLFDKQLDKLPKDKNHEIIFYCQGYECDLSARSAFKAEKLGYKNIKVYAAGVPDWEAKGEASAVDTDYIRKAIANNEDVFLIDARAERVADRGTLPGAVNISYHKFEKQVGKLPPNKAKPLIFFCSGPACDLSEKSAKKARAAGYTNVRIYPEGYPVYAASVIATKQVAAAAAAAKPPVPAPSKSIIETGKDKEIITHASFQRIIKENPALITIVDVRRPDQFAKGSWPGAISIPLDTFEGKLASIPKDKPIVFTCTTGSQSSMAFDMYQEKGNKNEAYILDAEVELVNGKLQIKK